MGDAPQPLAAALAALMRSKVWSPAEHKLRCLTAIASADVDEERRFLLVNLVETYLRLTGREAEEYAELVARQGNEEVRDMELTWAGRIQQKGYELGEQAGLERGREQGRVQGARQVALDLLEKRFGSLSTKTVRKVEAIEDLEDLLRLSERLLQARSLRDLDLD